MQQLVVVVEPVAAGEGERMVLVPGGILMWQLVVAVEPAVAVAAAGAPQLPGGCLTWQLSDVATSPVSSSALNSSTSPGSTVISVTDVTPGIAAVQTSGVLLFGSGDLVPEGNDSSENSKHDY
jgi:hypothetical protein